MYSLMARRLMAAIMGRLRGQTYRTLLAPRFPQYAIGRGSYGGLNVVSFGEGATLKMGAFCSIAAGVQVFLGGEHRVDWVTTYPFSALRRPHAWISGHPKTRGDVVIGNDVWVGREALILSGVTIGDGAVIGARAVVARDVAPYAIVAGNPANFVRSRFSPEVVDRLLAIRWWDLPESKLDKAIVMLLSDDIEAFLVAAETGAL
jgi:acetyltransferase-like isoleucine patch superfamily enzyme